MKISLPLRISIPLSLALLSVVLTGIEAAHVRVTSRREVEEQALRRAISLGHIVVPTLERAVLDGNKALAEDEVTRLALAPQMSLALVCDAADRLIFATDFALRNHELGQTPAAAARPLIERARAAMAAQTEITPDGALVRSAFPFYLEALPGELRPSRTAVLFFQLDLTGLKKEAMTGALQRSLLMGIVALLTCFLVWAYLEITFMRHLNKLEAGVAAYALDKGDLRVPAEGSPELADIGRLLNQMFAELSAKHAALLESEEKFSRAFAGAPVLMALSDLETGVLIEVNDEVVRTSGFTREELIGKSAIELGSMSQEDRKRLLATLREGGRAYGLEMKMRTNAGQTHECLYFSEIITIGGKPRILSIVQDITERKRSEEQILRYHAQLEAIYDSVPLMMCLVSEQGAVEKINRALAVRAARPFPEGKSGCPGQILGCLTGGDDPGACDSSPGCRPCPLRRAMQETLRTGAPQVRVDATLLIPAQGSTREMKLSVFTAIVRLASGSKLLVCLDDVTAQKQLEQKFLQAQKMEAIGQLAGGVAHDYNNILAATMMNLDLLQQKEDLDQETREGLKDLVIEAERAASLTRQLLMFSRRSVMDTQVLDLNEVVANLLRMLGRLLGENIRLLFERSHALPSVEADAGMLEQVLVNLAVNARDAMPGGGRITLATESVEIGSEMAAKHPARRQGQFVCLSVTDTGCGMDAATLGRVFEPFFSTKAPGKGTGLGLATVQGIVSQHQGWVEVESQPGEGTTFRVYLPSATGAAGQRDVTEAAETPTGNETLLVVEDDANLRRFLVRALRKLGYRVLVATNGPEAMTLWRESGEKVDLLFTDMMMPEGMTGLELAERLREEKPDLRIIISTGYSSEFVEAGRIAASGITYVPKPIRSSVLAKLIRESLDRKPTLA